MVDQAIGTCRLCPALVHIINEGITAKHADNGRRNIRRPVLVGRQNHCPDIGCYGRQQNHPNDILK